MLMFLDYDFFFCKIIQMEMMIKAHQKIIKTSLAIFIDINLFSINKLCNF